MSSKGIIIPIYIYPEPGMSTDRKMSTASGDTGDHGAYYWQEVIELKKQYREVPVIALVNPLNGPGEKPDALYTEAFNELKKTGIKMAGYVSTKYAGMVSTIGLPQYPLQNIKLDIDRWYAFYPMIDGIFFDEMARGFDTSVQEYYRKAAVMARAYRAELVIMNPGVPLNHRWFAGEIADIFITWENDRYPSITEAVTDSEYSQRPSDSRTGRGCLVMGQKFRKHEVKWILKPYYDWMYVTPSPLEPNPWNSVDGKTLKKLMKILRR